VTLEFTALDISDNNFLLWILDVKIYLKTMNLREIIKEENNASLQDCTKSMIFIRHHLYKELKVEYLTTKDPLVIWKNIKERYDHQKFILPSKLVMIGCTWSCKILNQLVNIILLFLKLHHRWNYVVKIPQENKC